jgi:hypothetical protein
MRRRPTPHADLLASLTDAELIEGAVLEGGHCTRCCPVCRAKPWQEQSTTEKLLSAFAAAAVGWGVWQELRPHR